MKKIIVLNLKMNLNYEEALSYVSDIKNKISDVFNTIFCPSFIYLDLFKASNYKLGAQNVYYPEKGAFTGEVSASQLKSMGIHYAIVGHSERRKYFNEDNKLVGNKIAFCLKEGLSPILCIGETIEEKQLKKTASVLKNQIFYALKDADKDLINDIIIAYEPVWAIGSGKTPSILEIEDAIEYIKNNIKTIYDVNAKVLYGGSVNKENIKDIIKIKNLDGVLIGSSSIDAKYLIEMLDLID
ncbi:MAG: triose-phosphate isomerase [Bacilli bacterium]|nr:triose-phosphate isomerase [Bacilli bacterium]